MASDSGWFVRNRGRILGPFPFAQLEVLRNRGQLAKFHELSQDRRTWVQAATFTDLFPPSATSPPAVETSTATEGPAAEVPMAAEYVSAGAESHAPATDGDDTQLWYYSRDKSPVGPFPLRELGRLARNGDIGQETLVWNLSLPDWVPARSIAALASPSPFATASREFPTLDTSSGTGSGTGTAAAGLVKLSGMALAGFVLGICGLLCGFLSIAVLTVMNGPNPSSSVRLIFVILITLWAAAGSIGVILSAVGMVRVARSPQIWRGSGMALTGLILGIVTLIGLLVLIVMSLIAIFGKA